MESSTTSSVFRDEAIPFITVDKDKSKYRGNLHKEFTINPEASAILKAIGTEQPLGVVAVAGMYRTGKSYLLNRVLLDRSDGFGVGPSINPCTKVSL